jgi:ABC-type uncharacterized transport system involved in gliding motility auxiliary subunit
MSKSGKILFVLSVIFFFILCGIRLVLGGFHPMMWVPLALTLLCFILAAVKDHRGILNFLTLRTTKHGMNMGALILLVLAGLFCINLLAVRYEKKWDWSSDKLNSLSDQSVKAAQGLKAKTYKKILATLFQCSPMFHRKFPFTLTTPFSDLTSHKNMT